MAVFVFVALYFVKAGYGMFRTKAWGWSISNKVAWVLMEAPVFIVMLWMWASNGATTALPAFLAFLLFELHYFQRSFVFPLLMKGKSRMPVAIMLMGITFNVINGVLIGKGLFSFPPSCFNEGAAFLLRGHSRILPWHGHQPALRPRNPPSAQTRRHQPLSALQRTLPLCHLSQLFRRTCGMDRFRSLHHDTCRLALRNMDGGQSRSARRCHTQALSRRVRQCPRQKKKNYTVHILK